MTEARHRGSATPEAAVETFFWAMAHRDPQAFMSVAPPEDVEGIRRKIESGTADEMFGQHHLCSGIWRLAGREELGPGTTCGSMSSGAGDTMPMVPSSGPIERILAYGSELKSRRGGARRTGYFAYSTHRVADERDADLSRILEFVLDLAAHGPRQGVALLVVELVGTDQHAHLPARLHRVALLHTGNAEPSRSRFFHPLEVGGHRFGPGSGVVRG